MPICGPVVLDLNLSLFSYFPCKSVVIKSIKVCVSCEFADLVKQINGRLYSQLILLTKYLLIG